MRHILILKLITILGVFSMNSCFASTINDSLTNKIITYVKESTGEKYISFLPLKISFALSSLSEDVIRRNYIKRFAYSQRDRFREKESLIKNVEDSLRDMSDKLNASCLIEVEKKAVSFDKKSDRSILFLSAFCSGVIFAELVNSYGVLLGKNGLELSGTVQTFMFKVVNGEIVEVYRGKMYCN